MHLPSAFVLLQLCLHTLTQCLVRDQLLLIASEVKQISWEGRQSYLPEQYPAILDTRV